MAKTPLKQNPHPGLFIDIEGPDGCGASIQINVLKKWLAVKDVKVFNTKEPTDNVIGGLIRGALTKVYSYPCQRCNFYLWLTGFIISIGK